MSTKKVPSVKDPTDVFQRDARRVFQGIAKQPLTDARLIKDVAIGTASTKVAHGLGRIPSGWLVVDTTADSRVFRDATATSELNSFLHLRATTAGTFTILVF